MARFWSISKRGYSEIPGAAYGLDSKVTSQDSTVLVPPVCRSMFSGHFQNWGFLQLQMYHPAELIEPLGEVIASFMWIKDLLVTIRWWWSKLFKDQNIHLSSRREETGFSVARNKCKIGIKWNYYLENSYKVLLEGAEHFLSKWVLCKEFSSWCLFPLVFSSFHILLWGYRIWWHTVSSRAEIEDGIPNIVF